MHVCETSHTKLNNSSVKPTKLTANDEVRNAICILQNHRVKK